MISRRFNLLISVILLLTVFLPGLLLADSVKLAWTPNSPDPDGYRLFMRTEVDGGDVQSSYDYSSPIVISGVTDDLGNLPASVVQVDVPGLSSFSHTVTRHYFVIRAYVKDDESADSNEVTTSIDRRAPGPPSGLVATFSRETNTITLSFEPGEDAARIIHWKLLYTLNSDNYVEFDTIVNTGQSDPTSTKPFTSVELGQRQTVYFAVVAFTEEEVFSMNSSEVAVDVDRRVPTAPVLTTVTIPVE